MLRRTKTDSSHKAEDDPEEEEAARLSRKRGVSGGESTLDERVKKQARALDGFARVEARPADEPPKATRGAAKTGLEQPAPRQLRVKLTGAPHLLREGAGSLGGCSDEASPSEAAGGAPVPLASGAQLLPHTLVLLTNGKIVYEAEIARYAERAPLTGKKAAAAAAATGARLKGGVRCGYYVHYTKWPKRAEEWVPEHVVVPWNEQLARGACTRPPRKDLWENPEASADDGAADEPPPSGAPLAPLKLAAAGAGASDLPLTFSPNASAARLTERQQMALLLKAEADGGAAPVAPAPQPPPAQPRAGGRSGRASGSAADEPDASAKGPAEGRAAAKAAGGGARARGGGARDALADKESEHKDLAAMSALDALAAGAFEASAAHEPATRRQLVGAAAEEEAGSEGEGEGEDGLDGADDESDDDADELLLDADGGEEGEEEAEGDDDGSDGEGEEGSASDGSEQDDEDGEGEENSSADDATDAEDEEADEERAAAHTDGVEPLDVENEDDDIDNASKFRAGRRRGRPGPMSPAMKQAPAFNFSSKQAGTAQALAAALSGKRRKGVPRRAIRSVAPCAELEAWEKGLNEEGRWVGKVTELGKYRTPLKQALDRDRADLKPKPHALDGDDQAARQPAPAQRIQPAHRRKGSVPMRSQVLVS